MKLSHASMTVAFALFSATTLAQEYPLGQPTIKDGMKIQGVYLQPITMDGEKQITQTGEFMPMVGSDPN